MSTPHPASGHRRRSTRSHHDNHPLAYVASNPRHLAPTVGRGAPSSGDLFWMGTLFLPGERSQPGTPEGVCTDALHGAEIACAASCLAELVGEVRLSDEPASDAGTSGPESLLSGLLDGLHVAGEPAADLESVGSTDPMLVDSDTASLDSVRLGGLAAFPLHDGMIAAGFPGL